MTDTLNPPDPASTRVDHEVTPWSAWLHAARAAREFGAMTALARELRPLREAHGPLPGHTPVRVALLGGGATQLLRGPLELALACAGLAPELHEAPFDRIVPELLDPESETARFEPELVVVLNTTFNIPAWPQPGDTRERAEQLAREACEWFLGPARSFHARTGARVLLNTFAPPPHRPHGNLSARLPGDPVNFVRRVNVMLGDLAPDCVLLSDVAGLVEDSGRAHWPDLRYWYHSKQPVSFEALPDYVRSTAALAGAAYGRSRRCLVLDLDGTLWGGVVADDGLEGIRLGEGDPAGEAFKAFQGYVRELRRRGVLLAVASKNEPETARLVFERHPECALTLEDFSAFEAGWGRKSESLRAIAARLNLGLDALVFVDDNPAEREEVRRALPEVAVVEDLAEPAAFPRALEAGRWFEAASLSPEDLERTALYRLRAAAEDLRGRSESLEEYLASLEMRAVVAPFGAASLERITQLTNKTNQYNLTTRRTSPGEVEAWRADPLCITREVRLADRFGQHGLVSVAAGRVEGDELRLDTWLMSCRVIGRGVERVLLNSLAQEARARDLRALRGEYLASGRNGPAADHYERLGFQREAASDGGSSWRLELDAFAALETPIATVEML